MSTPKRVLVIGYRKGLSLALKRLGIPSALWGTCPPKAAARFESVLSKPIGHSPVKVESQLKELKSDRGFTHVIAGTEEAVFAASVARRLFGARRTEEQVIVRCHDKLQMKSSLSRANIPMTPFIPYQRDLNPQAALNQLGSPVVVKERKSSGGRGVHLAKTPEEVKRYLRPQTLVEKYVDAPEGSVESFIHEGKIRFTNVTQYLEKTHINLVPAHYPPHRIDEVIDLNQRVIKALNIQWGLTHMEFYLAKEGALFGEIALRPPGGYLMDLMKRAYGFDPWEALARVELGEDFTFPPAPIRWTSGHVLHPGEGKVCNIIGADLVRKLPQCHRFQLKIQVDDLVAARAGVGQSVGHILLEGDRKQDLCAGLDVVRDQFEIRVLPHKP